MKLDFQDIAHVARCVVSMAVNRLQGRGFPGEAARAQMMADLWRDHAAAAIARAAGKLKSAPALQAGRELTNLIYNDILQAELKRRTFAGVMSRHL